MIGCFAKIYQLESSNIELIGCFAISFFDLVCCMFESDLIAGNSVAFAAEPRCASTQSSSTQLDWKYKFFSMPMNGGTSGISLNTT